MDSVDRLRCICHRSNTLCRRTVAVTNNKRPCSRCRMMPNGESQRHSGAQTACSQWSSFHASPPCCRHQPLTECNRMTHCRIRTLVPQCKDLDCSPRLQLLYCTHISVLLKRQGERTKEMTGFTLIMTA